MDKEIFDENRSEETGYGIEESEEPSVNTFSKEIIKEKVAYLNDKEKSIRERIKKENLAKQQEQESDFNKFKKILSIDPKNKDAIDKMRKLAQEKYEPAIK